MTARPVCCTLGVDPEFRDDVARIVEAAEKAMDTWTVTCTDFYPPPVVFSATAILRNVAGLAAIPWGGYAQVAQQYPKRSLNLVPCTQEMDA